MAPRPSQTDNAAPDAGDTVYRVRAEPLRIRDMPARIRPREEMARRGAENVSDDVLLAIVLGSGTAGLNVVELARRLVQHYGSLTALAAAGVDELQRFKGIGKVKAQTLKAALQIGVNLTQEALPERFKIRTPLDAVRFLGERVRALETEVFWSLHLDTRNTVSHQPVEISRGLLDASLVHPREVFREAVRGTTAAIVLAHNHPSGDPTPSAEDIRITRQLVAAGKIVDIKVLDHVIIGRPTAGERAFVSLREEGIVSFE